MKRFICFFLTGILLCGLIPVGVSASENAESLHMGYSNVLYSNDFTDYPYENYLGGLVCNNPLTQDNLQVWCDAEHGYVLKASMKKRGNDGHFVRVYGGDNSTSIFTEQTGQKWEISADVLLDVQTRLDISLWMGRAQSFFVPLRFTADGRIECGYKNADDGYTKYMDYEAGEWYRIKLYLDLADNTYSLMVNDSLLETDTPYDFAYDFFYAALYLAMNGLTDEVTAGDNWLWIDDISVSVFDEFGYDYKDDEGYCHTAFSDDFENGIGDGMWQLPDPSGVTVVQDPSGTRGQVVRLSGNYPRLYSGYSAAGQKLITEHYTTDEIQRVRIQADFRFDDLKNGNANAALNMNAYDAYRDEISTLISFNKGNPVYYPFNQRSGLNLTKAGEWKSGTWYTVTLYLDMARGLGTAKVTDGTNELTLLEDFDLNGWSGYNGSATRIDALRIEAGTSTEGAGYVDNVSYAVMAPTVKLSGESDTGGCVSYSYYPDLFGGEAATLFAATYEGDKLTSLEAVNLKAQKQTADEVAEYSKYASSMTDEYIQAHHTDHASFRYHKTAGETVRFYLWGGTSGCIPLEAATDATGSIADAVFAEAAATWRTKLVGNEGSDSLSELAVLAVESIDADAETAWNKQKNNADNADVLFSAVTATADMTQQYAYLNQMAKAWGTNGSTLYQNSELLTDILGGLDWMYEHYYGQHEIDGNSWRNPALYNWWDWLVGVPTQLTEILLILSDTLSESQITHYLEPFDYFLATEGDKHDAGSRVTNALASAVLRHDSKALRKYMSDLTSVLQITPQTFGINGLKADGSYIEHLMYLYNAGYGVSIIAERGMTLYSIFKDTGLLPQTLDTDVIELAIHETFEPILYEGTLFSSFSGRRSSSEINGGEQILAVLLDIADSLDAEEQKAVRQLIRRNVNEEMQSTLAASLTVHQATVLSDILTDSTTENDEAYERAKVYYAGDAVVQQRKGYAAALSMSSERRANYESINGMNLNGWYQSDGALYVYTDGGQFDTKWWSGRNPYRMPGVTADVQEREEKSIYYTDAYLSNQDFVGGAELGDFAAAAMALESFHNETDSGIVDTGYGGAQPLHTSTLTAKKSWFFFDNEIVCLGSDINADDGFEVETTIDNRMLSGSETITIGGRTLPGSSYNSSLSAPGWAHIDGFGGYWLPGGETLNIKKTGSAGGFLELWLSHGKSPTAQSYCYAVLPTATADETKAYSQNPDVTVLANNATVQAVCDSAAGLTGIVFWQAAACDGVSAEAPMTVLLQKTGDTLCVAVSDLTHKLTSGTLHLDGRYALRTASERITADCGTNSTELTINFAQSGGATLTAELEIYSQ